jgi:hypothetical protein
MLELFVRTDAIEGQGVMTEQQRERDVDKFIVAKN